MMYMQIFLFLVMMTGAFLLDRPRHGGRPYKALKKELDDMEKEDKRIAAQREPQQSDYD